MDEKDSEVVVQYLKRKRLEEYLIENQKYLYRIAFSYVKNTDDAFEIVQNTIYKSLSSIKLLKDINSLKPWVTRILVNNCFDFLKSNSKIILSDEVFEKTNDDNKNILDKIVLKKALDISQVLDMKENTVKTNLYKALKILKINLGEDLANV